MIDVHVLASALGDVLGLRHAPVALSFTREQPEGVDAFAGEVASACTFWRRAEERTFLPRPLRTTSAPSGR